MGQEPDTHGNGSHLDHVLADYMRRVDRGEHVDRDEFIAANPVLAEELRKYFSQVRAVDGFASAVTADFTHQTTPHGSLDVRCPNCHQPTSVAVDTQLTDLTCSVCGSHFSLVDQSKATRMAPSLSKMGRFELIERLGVGGFGSVWKARDKALDRTVAIKIPRAGGMTGEEQEKFFREARAAAQLKHPSIVSVHEVGRDGDSIYIVSDYVRGVTLGDWLTGQQLTSREAAELCAKIADALHHAHEQGVVHRDLKPANIMMDYDGQPHLMDFGLARRETGEVTMTMDGQVLGTPAYMSPEQAQGEAHTADRRADIYSLGVILFQLLTGELPFRGNARMLIKQVLQDEPPSPRKLNSNIPRDLETITLKCLEKDPAKRYQTAKEFSDECHRNVAGEPIQARPVSHVERMWRWCKRHRSVAALGALLFLALSAGTTASTLMSMRANRNASLYRQQRDRAEENLALAQVAVGKYVAQLAQDAGLFETDFHELRRQILETALPMYEKFAEQMPEDEKVQLNRADAFFRLAMIHFWSGRADEARDAYIQAIAIQTQLATKFPDSPQCRKSLAQSHNSFGIHLYLAGDLGPAREHFERALSISTSLAADFRDAPEYRSEQAWSHNNMGLLLRKIGDNSAREHYLAALDIYSRLADDYPEKEVYRVDQARALALCGRCTEATEIAESLLVEESGNNRDSSDYYSIACVFAICGDTSSALRDGGSNTDKTARPIKDTVASADERAASSDTQRKLWMSRTLELLRLAQGRGIFKQVAFILWLKKDPDFAGIRDEPEFRAFIDELGPITPVVSGR